MSEDNLYPYDWSIISATTKREHGYTCYICEQCQIDSPTLILNVHHKDYDPQNNEPDNLVVLCRDCHIRLHQLEAQERYRLKSLYRLMERGQLMLPLPVAFLPAPQESKIEFLRQVAKSHPS